MTRKMDPNLRAHLAYRMRAGPDRMTYEAIAHVLGYETPAQAQHDAQAQALAVVGEIIIDPTAEEPQPRPRHTPNIAAVFYITFGYIAGAVFTRLFGGY